MHDSWSFLNLSQNPISTFLFLSNLWHLIPSCTTFSKEHFVLFARPHNVLFNSSLGLVLRADFCCLNFRFIEEIMREERQRETWKRNHRVDNCPLCHTDPPFSTTFNPSPNPGTYEHCQIKCSLNCKKMRY